MVGIGAFTPLCNSSTHLTSTQNVSIRFLSLPKSALSPFSYNPNTSSFLSNHKCLEGRNVFCAFAVKKRRKDKGGVLERESFDNESYEFDEDADEGEEEDADDEEGFVLPMHKMKQWLENRPAGFGQGKAYDTSVEDKLLDEMQQSRVAQLANINMLKHNPIPTEGRGVPEVVIPDGVRVRLLNLPKKKNIHRDLQVAFKEVPGIISISPAVTGTKKTRDPICKGYGFVYFKYEEHANRFIQNFRTASIAFGKIQKQIKCELANPSSKDDALAIPMTNTLTKSSLPVLSYHEDETIITKISSLASNSPKQSESYESDDSDESEDSVTFYDSDEEIPDSPEPAGSNTQPKSSSSPQIKQEIKPPVKKKPVTVKTKGPKPAKLGSANKLKSKDKSLLAGVFSKYSANAQSTANKDS